MRNMFTVCVGGNTSDADIKEVAYNMLLNNMVRMYGERLPEGGDPSDIAKYHTSNIYFINSETSNKALFNRQLAEKAIDDHNSYYLTACRYWINIGKRYDQNVAKLLKLYKEFNEFKRNHWNEMEITTREQKKIRKLRAEIDETRNKLRKILDNKKNKTFAKNTEIMISVGFHS